MAISLWFNDSEAEGVRETGEPRSVLITGAAGLVGGMLLAAAAKRNDLRLRLLVETDEQRRDLSQWGDVVVGDIQRDEDMRRAVDGIDTVVNLAAASRASQPWEEVHGPNLVGVRTVLEAAKEAGCRRVVLLSSVNAISGCGPEHMPIHEDQAVAPNNVYGATKAFNEALGYHYARKCGLSVLCVRLGAVCDREKAARTLQKDNSNARLLITYDDTAQFLLRCVDDTRVRFGIFHAASDVENPVMDITRAREVLRYEPTRLTRETLQSEADTPVAP